MGQEKRIWHKASRNPRSMPKLLGQRQPRNTKEGAPVCPVLEDAPCFQHPSSKVYTVLYIVLKCSNCDFEKGDWEGLHMGTTNGISREAH
jgi:hypothetical protein